MPKTKKMIGIGLMIAGGVLAAQKLMGGNKPQPVNTPDNFSGFPQAPPAPKTTEVAAWEQWINQVVAAYNSIEALWTAPNAPFNPDTYEGNAAVVDPLLPNRDNYA